MDACPSNEWLERDKVHTGLSVSNIGKDPKNKAFRTYFLTSGILIFKGAHV